MRYAVVDVEWVNQPYMALAQIGGIMFDSRHKEISRLYHIVKLDTKKLKKGIKRAGFDPEMFKNGVSKSYAVKNFIHWLWGCNRIVVWSKDSADVLRDIFKSYKPTVHPDIIVVQEEYKQYLSHYSFEKVCMRYSIKMDKPLHISINDCEYLSKLYRIVLNGDLSQSTEKFKTAEEQHNADVDACQYWAIAGSTVFHNRDCRYVKTCNTEKVHPLFSYGHADILGYTPCKCCSPQAPGQYPYIVEWDFDAIRRYCNKLKVRCQISNELIYITTGVSTWFFFVNRTYIILHHENWTKNPTKARSNSPKSFHVQDISFTDPIDAIFYIYCHDAKMLKEIRGKI